MFIFLTMCRSVNLNMLAIFHPEQHFIILACEYNVPFHVGVLIKELVAFNTILSLARLISPDIGQTSINRFVGGRSIVIFRILILQRRDI